MTKTTAGFGTDPMLAPRYMNIPTFMRTPLVDDPSKVDIGLIGVPYDNAVTNRPGARHGPREVRNASTMMRTIHHATGINPYSLCRIGDLGDVPICSTMKVPSVISKTSIERSSRPAPCRSRSAVIIPSPFRS